MPCLPTLSRRISGGEGTRAAVRDAQERLKELGHYEGQADAIYGQGTEQAVVAFQRSRGLSADGIIGPNTWGALYDDSGGTDFSADALAQIASRPVGRVQKYVEPIQETMDRYEISTYLRRTHFLAQILHESARLHYTEEIWGPTPTQRRYEGRTDLGNVQKGDGYRYRGRGLIQLTGRANYEDYNSAVKPDVEANPDLVSRLPLAADAAGWFWKRNSLNVLADRDDVRAVTRRINGGYRGFADRKSLLSRAKRVLRNGDTPA